MSDIELHSVDHITVGAVGPPGGRIFMIQARSSDAVVTVVVEKEQVVTLSRGAYVLLTQVGYPEPVLEPDPEAMAIDEEQEPVFRTRAITLGYAQETDMVLLECEELPEIDPSEFDEFSETDELSTRSARFWISRAQLAALGVHGLSVVAGGRPICPYCWRPMDDPSAHVCRAMNGHDEDAPVALGGETE